MHLINPNIYIGTSKLLHASLPQFICSDQILVVCDPPIAALHLTNLLNSLSEQKISTLVLPGGEINKNWDSVEQILHTLAELNFDRSATVISLGGGLIGDLTGLAASLYMRGINWLSIPTTLLAQVDAAIGGKTGCNLFGQKNLIGTFYTPKAVLIDVEYLISLPIREFRAGIAETIKYGVVCDGEFFIWLEDNYTAIMKRDLQVLTTLVASCCAIKQKIVEQDLTDHNQRMLLNFGHSFAHALEAATGFSFYLHGEAVAIGMLLASRLAVKIGLLEHTILTRLVDLLTCFGFDLNLRPEKFSLDALYDYIKYDKKKRAGVLNFVLPCALGKAVIVPEQEVKFIKEILHSYV